MRREEGGRSERAGPESGVSESRVAERGERRTPDDREVDRSSTDGGRDVVADVRMQLPHRPGAEHDLLAFVASRPWFTAGATVPSIGSIPIAGIVRPATVMLPKLRAPASDTLSKRAMSGSASGGRVPKLVPDRDVPVPTVQTGSARPVPEARTERQRRGRRRDHEGQAREHAAHRSCALAPSGLEREPGPDDSGDAQPGAGDQVGDA